jgi:cytochrome c oxidase subunit 2
MRGVIEVVTQEEFDVEMAKIKPNYYAAFPDKDPANQQAAPKVDTSKSVSVTAGAPTGKASR